MDYIFPSWRGVKILFVCVISSLKIKQNISKSFWTLKFQDFTNIYEYHTDTSALTFRKIPDGVENERAEVDSAVRGYLPAQSLTGRSRALLPVQP